MSEPVGRPRSVTEWWRKVADALGLYERSESSEGELRDLRDQVVLLTREVQVLTHDNHHLREEVKKDLESIARRDEQMAALRAVNERLNEQLLVAQTELYLKNGAEG